VDSEGARPVGDRSAERRNVPEAGCAGLQPDRLRNRVAAKDVFFDPDAKAGKDACEKRLQALGIASHRAQTTGKGSEAERRGGRGIGGRACW